MVAGGLGPIEAEVIFTVIFIFCATLGVGGMSKPVYTLFGKPSWMSDKILWGHVAAVAFLLILGLSILDNVVKPLK